MYVHDDCINSVEAFAKKLSHHITIISNGICELEDLKLLNLLFCKI